MVTILHLNLGRRFTCDQSKVTLSVYETSMTKKNRVWQCSVMKPVQRRFLHLGADVFVGFQSRKPKKGIFKMLFSVHKESARLHKGINGAWNCSVPSFQEFKPHFPCDMKPQCANKEDEKDCPYFSDVCGLGFVTLADHCLVYVEGRHKAKNTWKNKETVCEQRGMRMANFRRREDFERLKLYLDPLIAVSSFMRIAVGIHSVSEALPLMYRNEMQYSDGSVAFYRSICVMENTDNICGFIKYNEDILRGSECLKEIESSIMCEISKTSVANDISQVKISLQSPSNLSDSNLPRLVGCPQGHITRDFLACDFDSTCWSRDKTCSAPLTPLPPSFTCANGVELLAYTMVCDVRPDCSDDSDETFCVFPPCDLPEPFHCSDHECVPWTTVCDGQKDCRNAEDEDLCSEKDKGIKDMPASPAIVHFSRDRQFTVDKLSQSQLAGFSPAVCPETHFQCPDDGYCMPVFLRCNGVYDCPGQEDEADCSHYTCPGFYHCRGSEACLHPNHLCDNIFQCPQNDDELLCDLSCPESCTCYGLAWYCRHRFHRRPINKLRFLDCRGCGMGVNDILGNALLIHLILADNKQTTTEELNFPNLHNLDLSDNRLRNIQLHDLCRLPQLRTLSLSGNPLSSIFQVMGIPGRDETVKAPCLNKSEDANARAPLRELDLSHVKLDVLNTSFLALFPHLDIVNMSGTGLDTVLGEGFQDLTRARTLDFRGCPLTHFPRDIFQGLSELQVIHSDNYKLCCPAILPADFMLKDCHAPFDKISSCEALLGSNIHRVFVSMFALLALLGNASSFLYRVFMHKKRMIGFQVFVAHLNVANFLMGVYLSVILVADRLYHGTFLWEGNRWMDSATCEVAGFLYLVSMEVSALVISCITVDRFLALRFPFGSIQFGSRSAQVASFCAWGVGCLIASVPLAPGAHTRQFYSRTVICAPLPVDVAHFPVAIGVRNGINIVLFIVIVAGQTYIYWLVRIRFVSYNDTTRKSRDLTIARRLITVAISDFLCWFPNGLVELLAFTGRTISGDLSVAMAIVVLPVNSALNPFLYMFNVVLEKVRRAHEVRIMKWLMAQFNYIDTDSNGMAKKMRSTNPGISSPNISA